MTYVTYAREARTGELPEVTAQILQINWACSSSGADKGVQATCRAHVPLPYVMRECFQAGNRASGPYFVFLSARVDVNTVLPPS